MTMEQLPKVPRWLERRYSEDYQLILRQELEHIHSDPDAYFSGHTFQLENERLSWEQAKERAGIETEELQELAHDAEMLTLEGFNFQILVEQEQRLLKAFIGREEAIHHEAELFIQNLGKLVHIAVLRRLVEERIPRRRAVLHRGSTKELPQSTEEISKKLGPLGNLIRFALKDTSFQIEEIRENLERGIGGFEFDVKTDTGGEIVVTHAITKEAVAAAPSLDALLHMIRELLPRDPHEARDARRGLMLFIHVKIPSKDRSSLEKILHSLDAHDLTSHAIFQTGRPETIYALDEIETRRSEENPKRNSARYAFQSFPLEAAGTSAQSLGMILEKLGLASRYSDKELRSLTNSVDEMPFLTEFPPKGKVLEILQRRRGVLAVASALYNHDLLERAREVGLGIHVGALSKGPLVEEFLQSDEYGNRPHSIMVMGEEALFPKAEESE